MAQKLQRRQSRENAFLVLFSSAFGGEDIQESIVLSREVDEYALDDFGEKTVLDYQAHAEEIDALIGERLQGWTFGRLPKVSLALLRLAVSEILYGEEKLPSVTINEVVELAKKYGDENDYQFINGLLGKLVKDLGLAQQTQC